MEIEVIEDKYNPLLSRRELRFRGVADGPTPSRGEVKKILIALLDASADTLVLDRMASTFGKKEFVGYAKLYDSSERAKEIEAEYILERNKRALPEEEQPSDKGEEDEGGTPSEETEEEDKATPTPQAE